MLSIAPLASADYYLGSSVSSGEAFAYFEANKGVGALDPLLRQGRWLGHFGARLGLSTDSPIAAADFEAIYYGLHPKTGKPLRSDGKSRKAQMADAKERTQCKQQLELASRAYNQCRSELRSIEKSIELSPDQAIADGAAHLLKHAQTPARSRLDVAAATLAKAEHAMRVARQKSLRPGTDLVFSAPKSVSMQWAALAATGDAAGAQVIEHAHDRAVRETFERLQSEFVMTRKRDPETSRRIFETVKGVIASQWRHFDARPTHKPGQQVAIPDPQLHDHINLFAPVQGADGQIYSAYTDYIRQNVKALGAMYRSRLASCLTQAGYQIERDAQKTGMFFALCGVGRDQAKALSARAASIEALMDQGRSVRDAKLHSRQAKNSLSGSDVLAAWGQTFAALGMDPQAVKVAGAEASIEREVRIKNIPTAAQSGLMARLHAERGVRSRSDAEILETLLSRDAHFSLSDIRQILWEDAQFAGALQSPESALDLDAMVESRLRTLLQSPDLLKVFDPNEPEQGGQCTGLNRFGEPVFTTHSLRLRETRLFGATVPALLASSGYGVDQVLALSIVRETEARLSGQSGKPFALRDFQLRAVLQAACGDGQLSIQIAGAGLGKTTASQFTKEILVAQGRRIIGVAPSNKAASGLGRELGIDACSIDRLLLDLASGKQNLDRNTVVFVDEAGMAGFDNMEKLLEQARDTGAKLILTGDPEQLPAVARGNVLRKLTEMDALASNPDALLYLGRHLSDWDRVSRQKADWAKQASTFFSRGYVDEGLREYERRGFVHSAMTAEHLGEDVADAYLKDPAGASEKLILATTNAQVSALNQCVRARLKEQGALTGAWVMPETGMELSLGDRVVFKARLKGASSGLKMDIAKNEFGTILSVARQADGSLNIQCRIDTPLSSGKLQIARFNSKDMEDLDHAFATTVHRSQGMTVDSVIAVPGSFISKELFYVMASRHRQSLQIHMLESDKATIRVNAAKGIQKRHANDLQTVEQLTPAASDRLKASNAKLAELAGLEQSRFDRIILAPLNHIQGVGDCVFATDTVAFGRMVDLLPQAGSTPGADTLSTRVAKGVVVHEDGKHLYLALPDSSRLLVVPRQDLQGLLDESVTGQLARRELELHFDPVTAKVTAATVAGPSASAQIDWLSDSDPVLLRQQLARACAQLGQASKAQALEQGRTAIVDLKGHRGNNLEGLVLGLSRTSAYVLSGLEVVRVLRGEPALNQLDDASVLKLLGQQLRLAIRSGRAIECTTVTGATGQVAQIDWAAAQGP